MVSEFTRRRKMLTGSVWAGDEQGHCGGGVMTVTHQERSESRETDTRTTHNKGGTKEKRRTLR